MGEEHDPAGDPYPDTAQGREHVTAEEKAGIPRESLFPPAPAVNLSDLGGELLPGRLTLVRFV